MSRVATARSERVIKALVNDESERMIPLETLLGILDPSSSTPVTKLYLLDVIEDSVAGELAKKLERNTKLESLSLRLKKVGDGTAALARALERNSTLKTLHLWEDGVTATEATANLAANLITNTALKNLTLCINLGDAGADIISRELKGKRTVLKNLELKSHGIGEARFNALRVELAERDCTLFKRTSVAEYNAERAAELVKVKEEERRKAAEKPPTVMGSGSGAGAAKSVKEKSWWRVG